MTNLEAKQHLARKLDIDYSDISNNGTFSETDLQVFIQLGVLKAWDYKPWPFSQRAKTGTTNSDGVTNGYYDTPQDLMTGSTFLLKVGGYEYKKLLMQDYLLWLENNPTSTDRIWAEDETYVFINANAYTVGATFDLYGKKLAPTLTADADLLPFSPTSDNYEHSGNAAIVQFAYAEALSSEKKNNPTKAAAERKEAYETLGLLWKPYATFQANQQSKDRPFFLVQDFFVGKNSTIRNNIGFF